MFQSPTKDEARRRIAELVENFERQISDYQSGKYNETQTRRDFIDPFFQALGWDVDNRNGSAEAYREVIHEDKVKVGKATKAPDYSFRLPGGQRLFFVEAKKPSVKIKDEALPAYQVRRYGWSAKLAISILTDFEELAVYDCTLQPSPDDKAIKGRTEYLTFREYDTRFDFLWDTFSKESVLRGGLDKFVASGSGKRGKETVDAAFLTTLEVMRAELAQGLASRNPKLDADELRFLVQMLLDRIIFLRIAEDRGIEPYADLREMARVKKKDEVYIGLLDRFRAASNRYNSGLFDLEKDMLSAAVRIDNAVLAPLLNRLYYPESPYEFSVIGAEILGSAYERFLGKVITLGPGRQVRIEDKPEVRRAGGVFYTPAYIVNYIVKQTLGPCCEGRTPQDVAKLRVLDPACGSGSFLLGAYQYLLDWHLAYYQAHPTAALPPISMPIGKAGAKAPARRGTTITPDGRLSSAVKKAILLNNLYGVDLDAQAVEVTKLSLLLKCLEGETSASIQYIIGFERVLPTIDRNIRVGNSLVETDFYDGEIDFAPGTEKVVKPFSWHDEFTSVFRQGGFDVVIGNPPYDVLEKERLGDGDPHEFVHQYLIDRPEYRPALGGKLNLFRFFVVKFVNLCKEDGRLGLIIPMSILADISCASSRDFILKSSENLQFDCFPQKDDIARRVFVDAKLSTVVITAIKNIVKPSPIFQIRTFPGNSFDEEHKKARIETANLKKIDSKNLPIPLLDEADWLVLRNIYSTPNIIRLGEPETGFKVTRGEVNQTVLRQFINEDKSNIRMLKGVEVGRYRQNYKLSQGKREWFDEKHFFKKNPPKNVTALRRIATQRITGIDERLRIVATVIDPQCYFADSTNSIIKLESGTYDLLYLLGLLNSRLFQWRFKLTSTNNNVGTNELDAMPFKLLKTNAEQKKHDEIVMLVQQLLAGYASLQSVTLTSAREQAQARLRHIERRIDSLVYTLYGLSDADIALVAG